jgi:hypothetical protein
MFLFGIDFEGYKLGSSLNLKRWSWSPF